MRILNTPHGIIKVKDKSVAIRCPNCARRIPHEFITESYLKIGKNPLKVITNHDYFVERGLQGMAKRWGKPVERLRKRYFKRLTRDRAKTER